MQTAKPTSAPAAAPETAWVERSPPRERHVLRAAFHAGKGSKPFIAKFQPVFHATAQLNTTCNNTTPETRLSFWGNAYVTYLSCNEQQRNPWNAAPLVQLARNAGPTARNKPAGGRGLDQVQLAADEAPRVRDPILAGEIEHFPSLTAMARHPGKVSRGWMKENQLQPNPSHNPTLPWMDGSTPT